MAKSDIKKRLSKEYLQAIGRIAAEYAMVERVLIQGISYIAFEYPWHANVFTSQHNTIYSLLKIFDSLLVSSKKNEATMKKFIKIRKEIDEITQKRNKIVHGHWIGYAGKSWAVGIINYRVGKRLTLKIEPYTPQELDAIADEIARVYEKLDNFVKTYVLSMSSLKKRRWKPVM